MNGDFSLDAVMLDGSLMTWQGFFLSFDVGWEENSSMLASQIYSL